MKRLMYDVVQVLKRNRDGSMSTQSNRERILNLCVEQLHEAGYKTNKMKINDLKGRHINALIKRWKAENISNATMKNRMSALRWLAEKTGNSGLIKSNDELGIEKRVYVSNEDKSLTLQNVDFSRVSPEVALSLRLQQEFGLRREEAMKFQYDYALKGFNPSIANTLHIKPQWSKGGRYRAIPITNDKQRQLLCDIINYCNNNAMRSLIPNKLSYKQHMKNYEHETSAVGVGRTHGLRHHYAQSRYKELTGFECSAVGGWRQLTDSEKELDKRVRLQISQELGHNRIQVTSIYLGSWSK